MLCDATISCSCWGESDDAEFWSFILIWYCFLFWMRSAIPVTRTNFRICPFSFALFSSGKYLYSFAKCSSMLLHCSQSRSMNPWPNHHRSGRANGNLRQISSYKHATRMNIPNDWHIQDKILLRISQGQIYHQSMSSLQQRSLLLSDIS